MFSSIRSLFRTVRMAAFPMTRTTMLLLAWSNRHTVALWFRSLAHELRTVGFDVGRMRTLLRGLWTVSTDRRTMNTDALRRISVRSSGFEIEARDGWIGRATVEHLLAPIGPHPTTMSVA